jgi:hypothetical protein
MASTYTSRLRLEKQADGENSSTWGQRQNVVHDLIDDSISGMTTIATTGGTTTLTTNNSAADQARMAIIKVAGALVSDATIAIPSQTKKYIVWNATSGAFAVSLKAGAGVAFAVAQGKRLPVFCDGADCYSAVTDRVGMGLGTAAAVDTGTSAGNAVILDESSKLPAVDGSQLTGVVASGGMSKNYANNGSFAVNQIVTPTTIDNSYPIDGWRLLLGAANAATFAQDSADVPTGAGYAAKLIVGSGNNNKFGIFCPIENRDILDARGQAMSLRVALKATAGLTDGTGKIRIGLMQWTGTADAISATPISAWGNEGTNPTLIANWAFVNTPAALSVTASWADYTIANQAISASATNLGLLIWSDDKANTQTTDILRVGGYITMSLGSSAPAAQVAAFDAELRKCQRYYNKTFPYSTAAAQNAGTTGALTYLVQIATTVPDCVIWAFPQSMRIGPTMTYYNPSNTNSNWRSVTRAADNGASSSLLTPNESFVVVKDAGAASQALGDTVAVHAQADARL